MTSATFTLDELLSATGGSLMGNASGVFSVSTDTRTLGPGTFFLPLSGENFDGHNFITQAVEKGASGVFVSKEKLTQNPDWKNLPCVIAVENTLLAYLALARFHRQRSNCKIVAITGSSGKTTTKEMLYAALSPLTPTQCSQKNHNNEVGVSQTLLSIQPDTKIMIVEMGMRGLGEIALLTQYAEPDIAIVINVGPAHIGRLGSLENIAQAKCEIFSGLKQATGIGIVNGDDALLTQTAAEVWTGTTKAFQLSTASQIRPRTEGGIGFEYQGQTIVLSLPGLHNVSNALAVMSAGESLGFSPVELASGLAAFAPIEGRWQKTQVAGLSNTWVINDAYNANPDSTLASLRAFLENPVGDLKRILVLGGMKELGEFTEKYHQELGAWLQGQNGIAALILVGEESVLIRKGLNDPAWPVLSVENPEKLGTSVAAFLQENHITLEGALFFLKGSRVYGLENLVNELGKLEPV